MSERTDVNQTQAGTDARVIKDNFFMGKELRTMAEVMNVSTSEAIVDNQADINAEAQGNQTTENSEDVAELLTQIAEMKAQLSKTKNALDKSLKEKGDITKQLRAKQTAEEREEEARKEAEREKNEKFAAMERELNHIKAVAAYRGKVADDKIDILIDAVTDNDHEAIANAVQTAYERGKKDGQAEYLKNRPQVAAGSGSGTMTVDEIMAIKDIGERQRAIAQNIHLFE